MQPDLSNYYGDLKAGVDYFLEGQVAAWVKIGSGTFSTLSPQSFTFNGSYDVLGKQGNVTLAVAVTGVNVGTVNFNGQRGQCSFQEDGEYLHILFGGKDYKLNWWRSGIWIGGDVPINFWIGA